MNFTLIRVGLSNIKHHPWQTPNFLILGVTLGVAVIVAIDIANHSALRSFSMSLESISGKATHRIIGGTWGVDEKIYVDLKTKLGIRKCAPVINGYVNAWDDRAMNLLVLIFLPRPLFVTMFVQMIYL